MPGSGSVRKIGAGWQHSVGVHVPTMCAMCVSPWRCHLHVPVTRACPHRVYGHVRVWNPPRQLRAPLTCAQGMLSGSALVAEPCHPIARCCRVGENLPAGLEQRCQAETPRLRADAPSCGALQAAGAGILGCPPHLHMPGPIKGIAPCPPHSAQGAWVGAGPCFWCPCPPGAVPPEPSLPMCTAMLSEGGLCPLACPGFGAMGSAAAGTD